MKKIFIVSVVLIFFFIACGKKSVPPQDKSESPLVPKVIVEKEKVEKVQPLPPEVKIKLKKNGKDSYSWELTGSDVDQILKVDEKLSKQLGGKQTK
jgi:ABC-type Zn uptake system ZnuABC Zn-binding protein ZnuA